VAQPSNPTRRVIEVLNFLAGDPDRSFTLTEIGRELQISKATLHAVVGTLLDAGYLVRSARDRRVGLGPMLIPVGRAALGHHAELIEQLRPAMRQLATTYDAHCLVSAAMGEWIVVLAAAGTPSRVLTTFREGQRASPLEPPMGSLFVAWQDTERVEQWLATEKSIDPLDAALHRSALEEIRAHGFAVARRVDALSQIQAALQSFATGEADDPEPREAINSLIAEMRSASYLVTDYEDDTPHEVDWIGVPVFGPDREIELALVMMNFPQPLSHPQVAEVADRLKASADEARQLIPDKRTPASRRRH
jgi:DNA-binding IclR family transcriptional regulator